MENSCTVAVQANSMCSGFAGNPFHIWLDVLSFFYFILSFNLSVKFMSQGTYMNFTNSISDPDYWFVPPASCSNATQQVGLSGLLSITDNYSN